MDSPIKLRVHIRELTDKFAEAMADKGHAKMFFTVEGTIDKEFARSSGDKGNILDWIRETYRDSRGAELPGTVNPVVLENMFRRQSSPWEGIATVYLERVTAVVQEFNKIIFERMIPDDDLRGKLQSILSPGEKMVNASAREQLSTILNDERGGILQTVNHYFADTLSTIREDRILARLKASGFDDGSRFITSQVMKPVHLSNEDQAVNDIHDILKAYYKVAMKRFTNNIVLQVTERHILGAGGPIKTLSREMIGDLQDGDLMDIAGENFATSSTRNELIAKCDRFKKALDIAKQAVV